MSTNHTHSTSN